MLGAALAAWVAFTPCGYAVMASDGEYGFEAAPNLARIWIRTDGPRILLVPLPRAGSPSCVYIKGPGGQALVLGTDREVLCKLAPQRPECSNHAEP